MRASGINRAFMQARSLSAGPVIAASIAAGMPLGSEGNAQPASGACAIAVSVSAPARIVNKNSVRSIFSPSDSGRCPRSGRLPHGLLVGCVDLYQIGAHGGSASTERRRCLLAAIGRVHEALPRDDADVHPLRSAQGGHAVGG